MTTKKKMPPIRHLSYSKGDLIVKEGDYGISIYKVLKGSVLIFKQSGAEKVSLARLERGEVFGEMTFFNFLLEPRSASVEAAEEVELEVWHPAMLTDEYQNMSPMLRYILKQTLGRLLSMNRMVKDLSARKTKKQEGVPGGSSS
jgi:CRP-like cAMP-binding protein